jgi:preprotein translocase subunit SecA
MISYIMKKIIGSQNDREIKRLAALVDRVNEYESEFQSIPNSEFAVKTGENRERVKNGLNASTRSGGFGQIGNFDWPICDGPVDYR